MTEAAFQEARKVMQKANYMRGIITSCKGEVAKWSNIEDSHRAEGRESQAGGTKKLLDKALIKLAEARKRFADLQFPDANLSAPPIKAVQCENCGASIAAGNTYCKNCLT